jgi:hypothetical protein
MPISARCRWPMPAWTLLMPHTLEPARPRHAARGARVLMPEGKVLIFGLNPGALGCPARAGAAGGDAANATRGIAYLRLRDWLRLLELRDRGGGLRLLHPTNVQQARWQQRWGWMNRVGAKAWPILGAVYCVVAVKRVQGMRLLSPAGARACQCARGGARGPAQSIVEIQGYEVVNKVVIYTDGACKGNPGPGGWGVLLQAETPRRNCLAANVKPPTTVWSCRR